MTRLRGWIRFVSFYSKFDGPFADKQNLIRERNGLEKAKVLKEAREQCQKPREERHANEAVGLFRSLVEHIPASVPKGAVALAPTLVQGN
jgi:hypothetical protein